jgi:hypothetical protein
VTDAGSGTDSGGAAVPVTLARPAPPGVCQSILFDDLALVRAYDGNAKVWHIDGPLAPRAPIGEGVQLEKIKFKPIFKHIDQQSAHQVGVTRLDTTWDAAEVEMTLKFIGRTPGGARRVFRQWLSGWDPRGEVQIAWFTTQLGNWWIKARQLETMSDDMPSGNETSFEMDWNARCDFPWFRSFDSRSPVMTADADNNLVDPLRTNNPGNTQLLALAAPTNFMRVTNFGDQPAFPTHLLQGPGTFTLGDNGAADTVTIPVKAGQLVYVTTDPAVQTVTDVNTAANLYPLVSGRFSQPVPAGPGGYEIRIPIAVTGSAQGITSALTRVTALRRWPQ